MTEDRLSDAGDAVAQILVADATLSDTAQRVAELARAATGAASARITVQGDHGDATTIATTGDMPDDAPAIALQVGSQEIGALQLSGDAIDATAATRFADRAAIVLVNARAYWAARETSAGLQAALDSRAVIDMAKGKLMAQGGLSPDDAFALLVKASQRENVKLREIAQRIVYSSGDTGTIDA